MESLPCGCRGQQENGSYIHAFQGNKGSKEQIQFWELSFSKQGNSVIYFLNLEKGTGTPMRASNIDY